MKCLSNNDLKKGTCLVEKLSTEFLFFTKLNYEHVIHAAYQHLTSIRDYANIISLTTEKSGDTNLLKKYQ